MPQAFLLQSAHHAMHDIYTCAPLQSAGDFTLEGDWTPSKTKLLQLAIYRGGSLIFFQDKT